MQYKPHAKSAKAAKKETKRCFRLKISFTIWGGKLAAVVLISFAAFATFA
jgi:hypothetical protein